MKELVGWAALALSLAGLALVARGVRAGWAARLSSQPLWFAFAMMNHSPVYMATCVLYGAIDAYGWIRRSRKPRHGEKKGLVRIHGEPRGPINLWAEH